MPDVQRAADRRRRRVDREHALARSRAVEAVAAVALPRLAPLSLEPVERRALRDRRGLPRAPCGSRRRVCQLIGRQAFDRIRPPRPDVGAVAGPRQLADQRATGRLDALSGPAAGQSRSGGERQLEHDIARMGARGVRARGALAVVRRAVDAAHVAVGKPVGHPDAALGDEVKEARFVVAAGLELASPRLCDHVLRNLRMARAAFERNSRRMAARSSCAFLSGNSCRTFRTTETSPFEHMTFMDTCPTRVTCLQIDLFWARGRCEAASGSGASP